MHVMSLATDALQAVPKTSVRGAEVLKVHPLVSFAIHTRSLGIDLLKGNCNHASSGSIYAIVGAIVIGAEKPGESHHVQL